MNITLNIAESLLSAARAKAITLGIAVSIVVLDSGSNLKAFARMDGAWLGSIDVALKKAKTSALFEMETQTVWDVCNPQAQAHGLEFTNDGLVTFAGGIPIKSDDGQLLGSIGVSGGQVEQDLLVARAGVAALLETSGF